MTTETIENPSVYVGTYAKYNEGNLFGEWVDLTQFDNRSDFIDYCLELHKDEESPELMFQDFDNFPEEFYSECGISDKLWDYIELDDDQREILDAFVECFGTDIEQALERYEDAYYGHWGRFRDFVKHHFNECNEIPNHLESYIDYDAVERDYDYEFIEHNGHVFNRNW